MSEELKDLIIKTLEGSDEVREAMEEYDPRLSELAGETVAAEFMEHYSRAKALDEEYVDRFAETVDNLFSS
jgi:RNA processing factor Prp31